jgi:hypothetical protein
MGAKGVRSVHRIEARVGAGLTGRKGTETLRGRATVLCGSAGVVRELRREIGRPDDRSRK